MTENSLQDPRYNLQVLRRNPTNKSFFKVNQKETCQMLKMILR